MIYNKKGYGGDMASTTLNRITMPKPGKDSIYTPEEMAYMNSD